MSDISEIFGASPEEAFEKGAMDRYAERGIEPDLATRLFQDHVDTMRKLAVDVLSATALKPGKDEKRIPPKSSSPAPASAPSNRTLETGL